MPADPPLGPPLERSLGHARGRTAGPATAAAGGVVGNAGGTPLPLTTPLVWAWGGVLLTASTWLVGVIALFRSVGGLFD